MIPKYFTSMTTLVFSILVYGCVTNADSRYKIDEEVSCLVFLGMVKDSGVGIKGTMSRWIFDEESSTRDSKNPLMSGPPRMRKFYPIGLVLARLLSAEVQARFNHSRIRSKKV